MIYITRKRFYNETFAPLPIAIKQRTATGPGAGPFYVLKTSLYAARYGLLFPSYENRSLAR
jgi:hypothetical protein